MNEGVPDFICHCAGCMSRYDQGEIPSDCCTETSSQTDMPRNRSRGVCRRFIDRTCQNVQASPGKRASLTWYHLPLPGLGEQAAAAAPNATQAASNAAAAVTPLPVAVIGADGNAAITAAAAAAAFIAAAAAAFDSCSASGALRHSSLRNQSWHVESHTCVRGRCARSSLPVASTGFQDAQQGLHKRVD